MDRISHVVSDKWVVLAARLLLGAIFLVSAIGKLQHPALFVDTVVDYGLLPEGLSRFYGAVLPWAEVAVGFSLVLGLLSVLSAILSIGLALSFAIAAIYSFSHPAPAMCGCFGELVSLTHTQSLAMDVAMLLMAVAVVLAGGKADELGLARWLKGVLHGRPAWLAAALKLAAVAVLTLALGLAITATNDGADGLPETENPRLMYFWNGCRTATGPRWNSWNRSSPTTPAGSTSWRSTT